MKDIDNILGKTISKTVSDLQTLESSVINKYITTDVSRPEMKALEAIYLLKQINSNSMIKVANKVNVTAGTMTTCINRMIKKGLVKKISSGEDRRISELELTKEGKECYLEYVCLNQKIQEVICEDLTNSEKLILNKLLEKLLYIYENV